MAESKTRIYVVAVGNGEPRLVRAANSTAARAHVAKEIITAKLPSQDQLLELAGKVKVEDATASTEGNE